VRSRLAFLGLDVDDRAILHGLRPLLERHADELVAGFYRHLLAFEPTRALLSRPEVVERLLGKQRAYLLSLADDPSTASYEADRVRIGVAHERIGLAPRWYLGAYALYFSLLVPKLIESYGADLAAAGSAILALQRVLMLDAQLAMEAYIESDRRGLEGEKVRLEARGERLERELQTQELEIQQTTRRARAAEALASSATLVAGLAHEIGTPMGVIQGHADLLETTLTDERARWRVRMISDQIKRITRIIQALLSSARPRGMEAAVLELEPLIKSTLSFLEERCKQHGIRVATEIAPLPSLMADREKLQQLLLNLFLNAMDAMPDGGELRVTANPLASGEVEVRVGDSGPGVPPEILDRIFEPFFTTKPAGQGNGLGLAVADGIVRDHGGTLEATSAPGQGTVFRFTLGPGHARQTG
jgi:signal transduction histidine kinase